MEDFFKELERRTEEATVEKSKEKKEEGLLDIVILLLTMPEVTTLDLQQFLICVYSFGGGDELRAIILERMSGTQNSAEFWKRDIAWLRRLGECNGKNEAFFLLQDMIKKHQDYEQRGVTDTQLSLT